MTTNPHPLAGILDTIIEGDCLDVMRDWPDNCVDAVVADPPWMDYATGRYDASEWHKPVDVLSPNEYAPELYRVAASPSAMILWCRWDVFDLHARACEMAGWAVKNQIIWAKPNHTAGDLNGNLGYKHECAIFAVKGKWTRHGKREVNLWHEGHLFSRARRDHPTEKPVELMRRSVRCAAPAGSVVLDCFCGSGSTCIACIAEGHHFIGIEKEHQYAQIARRRVKEAQNTLFHDQ